jgi:hypothetical protein
MFVDVPGIEKTDDTVRMRILREALRDADTIWLMHSFQRKDKNERLQRISQELKFAHQSLPVVILSRCNELCEDAKRNGNGTEIPGYFYQDLQKRLTSIDRFTCIPVDNSPQEKRLVPLKVRCMVKQMAMATHLRLENDLYRERGLCNLISCVSNGIRNEKQSDNAVIQEKIESLILLCLERSKQCVLQMSASQLVSIPSLEALKSQLTAELNSWHGHHIRKEYSWGPLPEDC